MTAKAGKWNMEAYRALYGDGKIDPSKRTTLKRSFNQGQKKRPVRRIEYALQVHIVSWALGNGISILAIPNDGNRGRIGGHRAKLAGLRAGASDLFIAHPKHGYGGFWMELKRPGEKPRDNQILFMEEMRKNGYLAEWYDDFEKAKARIMWYMGISDSRIRNGAVVNDRF